MPFYSASPRCRQFEAALAPFLPGDGLPFADVLPAAEIQQVVDEAGVICGTTPQSVYTPAVVVWAFLGQVLGADKSCRAAVLRVLVLLVALGRRPCALDTGAYCRARAKLPALVWRRLAVRVGRQLEGAAPSAWLWHGRHVHLVDGTTVALPDTPENQQTYPQPATQRPGLGFPLMRMVLLLSLATAAVQDMACGPYQGKETGEPALFRTLLDELRSGEIVLADRYYCSYFLVALALARGVDVVVRLHQRRHYDFRRGWRVGPDDHIVWWSKPARPAWMDPDTYDALPQVLQVREIRVAVTIPGFRPEQLVIATTLTNARAYRKEDIADLYHERWHVELDIRAIKTSLKMDVLRCKTPGMVAAEIWAHLLAYNLVRKVAAQAALAHGGTPRHVSFTGTAQAILAGWDQATHASAGTRRALATALLEAVAGQQVGQRPNRCEPRAVKRRPKPHPLLRQPRAAARAGLLGGRAR